MTEYTDTVPLRKVAKIFQVHPRTILRHFTKLGNPTWHRAYNPDLKIEDVAHALGITPAVLRKVLNKQDSVLTAREAAATLDMPVHGFKHKHYRALIRGHKFTRWLRSTLIDEHTLRFM